MSRLVSHLENTAMAIAYALAHGAEAKVVGEKLLTGAPLRYLEIDGVPVHVPKPTQKEAPGVRVTHKDGTVSLYLATNKERAEAMLRRALKLVQEARGGSEIE